MLTFVGVCVLFDCCLCVLCVVCWCVVFVTGSCVLFVVESFFLKKCVCGVVRCSLCVVVLMMLLRCWCCCLLYEFFVTVECFLFDVPCLVYVVCLFVVCGLLLFIHCCVPFVLVGVVCGLLFVVICSLLLYVECCCSLLFVVGVVVRWCRRCLLLFVIAFWSLAVGCLVCVACCVYCLI